MSPGKQLLRPALRSESAVQLNSELQELRELRELRESGVPLTVFFAGSQAKLSEEETSRKVSEAFVEAVFRALLQFSPAGRESGQH